MSFSPLTNDFLASLRGRSEWDEILDYLKPRPIRPHKPGDDITKWVADSAVYRDRMDIYYNLKGEYPNE